MSQLANEAYGSLAMVAYTRRHADLVAKMEEMASQEQVEAPASPSTTGQPDSGTTRKRGGAPSAVGGDESPAAKKPKDHGTVRANMAESAQLGTPTCCCCCCGAACTHDHRGGPAAAAREVVAAAGAGQCRRTAAPRGAAAASHATHEAQHRRPRSRRGPGLLHLVAAAWRLSHRWRPYAGGRIRWRPYAVPSAR